MSVKPSLEHSPTHTPTSQPEPPVTPQRKPTLGSSNSFAAPRTPDNATQMHDQRDDLPGAMRRTESSPAKPGLMKPASPSGLRGLSLPAGMASKIAPEAQAEAHTASRLISLQGRAPSAEDAALCQKLLTLADHPEGFKTAMLHNGALGLLEISCHSEGQAGASNPADHRALLRHMNDRQREELGPKYKSKALAVLKDFMRVQARGSTGDVKTKFTGTRLVRKDGQYTLQPSGHFGCRDLTPESQDLVVSLHANLLTGAGVPASALTSTGDAQMGPITEAVRARMLEST